MTTLAKIPTVGKFLCYFDLATGGYVLGGLDAAIYGLTLLFLVLNMLLGMSIISTEQLNRFSVLGLVIDAVVQLVLMFFFFCISLAFVKGVKDKSPKTCLPYVILTGLQAGVSLLEGLVFLSPIWIIVATIKAYFFIVIYSLFKLLSYGDEQDAYVAHQNAQSAGYEQYYEHETYSNYDKQEGGYQTTDFNEP